MTNITYDSNDLQSIALCVWKEARGEGNDGMRAVMHVIANRARAWYSHVTDPIHYAVYAKNQFTSMSVSSDPEYNLGPRDDDAQYTYCLQIATPVLNGVDPDPTDGALYYARLSQVTSGWFKKNIIDNPTQHPHKADIGHQVFYG
jgi:N-acetylmuramoyl-L-alanine amidase